MSNILKTLAAGSVSGDYQISRSLRFNSADSAYLSRTPASAGNRKTWTWSAWVKRCASGGNDELFVTGATDGFVIRFVTDNTIRIYSYTGTFQLNLITSAVYRDFSAWYHIVFAVDTTQATDTNRAKLYVNGTQVTAFGTAVYPTQNTDLLVNQAIQHSIGSNLPWGSTYANTYLADINFIDGQALTPSSFGEVDAVTGVWKPIAYAGTYGTNGFHLDFSDNSSTTALGYDAAGSNDWTPNNFSVTAGAGNDSLVDSPTQYGTDTGAGGEVRGNYATLNPLDNGGLTLSNGNLDLSASAAYQHVRSGFGLSSGKWYFEVVFGSTTASTIAASIGVATASAILPSGFGGSAGIYFLNAIGSLWFNNQTSQVNIAGTISAGTVLQCAIDIDSGKVWIGQNNTWYNSSGGTTGAPSTGSNPTFSPSGTLFPFVGGYSNTASVNFGQRPFAYTAPSGFKALCTTNLPDPTVLQGDDHFNTLIWTGADTGTSRSFTGVGFQPDLVWAKIRSEAYDHALYDSVRGAGTAVIKRQLYPNGTASESSGNGTVYGYLSSFDSDGFTWERGSDGSGANPDGYAYYDQSGATYVAWNWKANGSGSSNTDGTITSTVSANTTAGISIVTYTGTGANATVGHGLGVAPRMLIIKRRDSTGAWRVGHSSLTSWAYRLNLNETAAEAINTGAFNSTAPTSTVFSIGTEDAVNASGGTYVAYCFAEVEGFSKFGSYIGNGSTDGAFVYTGFRPAFVLAKRSSTSGNSWYLIDTARDPFNVTSHELYAEGSGAEYAAGSNLDIVSNGFKVRASHVGLNGSGSTYIYACFAEHPFRNSLAR